MATKLGYEGVQRRIAEIDALSRTRALTNPESLELERLIKAEEQYAIRNAPRRSFWSPAEEAAARQLRAAGNTYDAIARAIGRSANAVAAHLRSIGAAG